MSGLRLLPLPEEILKQLDPAGKTQIEEIDNISDEDLEELVHPSDIPMIRGAVREYKNGKHYECRFCGCRQARPGRDKPEQIVCAGCGKDWTECRTLAPDTPVSKEEELRELRHYISVFGYIAEHCRSEHRIVSEAEAMKHLFGIEQDVFGGSCACAVRKIPDPMGWECESCLLYEYLPEESRRMVSIEQAICPCDLLGYAGYIEAVTANGMQGDQIEQIAGRAEEFRDGLEEIYQSAVSQ